MKRNVKEYPASPLGNAAGLRIVYEVIRCEKDFQRATEIVNLRSIGQPFGRRSCLPVDMGTLKSIELVVRVTPRHDHHVIRGGH